MSRRSKGYSAHVYRKKGKWVGRLQIKKPDGSTKDYTYQGRNKTHAQQVVDELEAKYIAGGAEALDAEDMTFADLADHYKKVKVIDAVFDGDIKVAGMMPAGKESAEKEIKGLLEYWKDRAIQKITHADIEEYKLEMLRKPVVYRWWKKGELVEKTRTAPRKMVSVNHLLRRLKAMLNFARRKGWLAMNPFSQGESLISEAAEVPRNRAEKEKELQSLLAACVDRREYLRPIILIMADSSLRLTEAKRLTRAEIDFDAQVVHVRARNTKGNKPRIVPLSGRLAAELRVWADKAKSDDVPILQQGSHKTAWKNVKEAAKITDDLQLRDLRGWGTSRMVKALAKKKLPAEWGMKITGHTQVKTFQRYIKTDEQVAHETRQAMEDLDDKAA
jgi:integrase